MKLHFTDAGLDFGNSELDAIIEGKLIRQPNVFAVAGQNPWADDDLDVKKNLKNIYDNIAVSIISGAVRTNLYVVGRYALKTFGENVTSLYVKGNRSKADQDVPYVNTLAIMAARAVEKAIELDPDVQDIDLTIDMSAALPVKQHTPANIEIMKKKFMDGTHTVSFHLGLTKKIDVKISFEYVHLLQEGTPPVFALQMDSEGNWRTGSYMPEDENTKRDLFSEFAKEYNLPEETDGSYLDGKNILHLDLGDGTADSPFTKGDAVDNDFCDGVNHGVGHAISDSINDLLSLAPHAFNSVSRQQYSDILRSEFSDRPHKFLSEAKQAFRPHCENQANQIIKHITDQILKIGANEIDILTVYGGGSILMKEQLYPKLKELADKSRIQLFYVPAQYAVTLNAEGLDYFVRSDIYKALKARAVGIPSTPQKSKKEIASAQQR
ncbi:hypothetical protein [Cohnella soli]|uniref:ParM/StbA family protein n=1 Tax=Cohnella soli TaxID=425005 RepID=A0ABW0HPG0_9BACL